MSRLFLQTQIVQHSSALMYMQVTCGSTIKLAHAVSDARLHSHEVQYSRGSQQQSVTGFPESGDAGSYWVVHGSVVSMIFDVPDFKLELAWQVNAA